MPSVSVVFNAETGQYVSNVQGMEKATGKAADSVEQAKARILAYHKEQIQSAVALGASSQQLESIYSKTSQAMANVTEQNYRQISNSTDALVAKLRAFAAERAALGKVESTGHGISDRMAASSLVRGLENGNVGIRTVENFITTLPGASAALQGFFSIAGPLAFAGAVGEGIAKVVELYDKAEKLPKAIHDGWEGVNEPLILSIDNMRKVNDQLEIAHAKFEHKPENLLALAIDEDRIKADQLAASARKAASEIGKMLDENKSGFMNYLFTGAGSTGPASDTIKGWFAEISKKRDDDRDAKRSGTDTPEAAARRKQDLSAFIQQKYKEAGEGVSLYRSDNKNGRYDSIINDYAGARSRLGLSLDNESEEDRNAKDERQHSADAQMKQQQEDAEEAARKAAEATRKAAETQFKGFEETLNRRKETEQLGVTDEIQFWERMLAPAQKYAENVQKIHDKLGPLNQKYFTELTQLAAKAVTEQQRATAEAEREDNKLLEMMTRWEQQSDAAADADAKLAETKRKNSDEMADWTRAQEVATGALSRHDAAMQQMAQHAAEYTAQLADLDEQQKRLDARSTLDPDQRRSAQDRIDQQRESISGQRNRQLAVDQLGVQQSSPMGALTEQLIKFRTEALDTTNVLSQLTMNGLGRFNQAALSALTDPKHAGNAFKEAGKGIFTDVAGAGLHGLEGMALKGLHLGGEKLGSQNNPMWTRSADPTAQMSGGFDLASLGKSLFGGGDKDGDGGGFLAGLGGSLMDALPGFATGGYVGAGTMAMVGEHGPEPVFFGDQARVMSNSDMRSAIGGGGGGNVIHVDARGAHDPAAVSAAARQGAQAGAVAGRTMANQDRAESKRRQIGMGRK